MLKPSCLNCRFASFGHGAADRGECRRAAPRTTLGQLEPGVSYAHPEMGAWPGVMHNDICGEHQFTPLVGDVLVEIVRERLYGDGTAACEQRVIDLAWKAQRTFRIDRAA